MIEPEAAFFELEDNMELAEDFLKYLSDDLVQPVERAAADEQDVRRVDLDELLLRVLASAVGRHVADRALHDLQQQMCIRDRMMGFMACPNI